jgi:4-hydroxy-tetrahydrodipicolinate reductase
VKGLDQKLSQSSSSDPDAPRMSFDAPLRVAVFGSSGRMGSKLIEAINAATECTLVAAMRRHDRAPAETDVVIDFSAPEGSKRALEVAKAVSAALLVGTTGLDAEFHEAAEGASEHIPVMVASNTSLGVAVMHRMVEVAVRGLGPGWRVDLQETHHTRKVDAPSGTALALAATVRGAGGDLPKERIVSIREGDVVGRHALAFTGPGERIVLEHEALDRALFAQGALVLARWLRRQPPGMHAVQAWLQERMNGGTRA